MNIITCDCNDTIKNSFVYLSKDIIDLLQLSPNNKDIVRLDDILTGEMIMLNWRGGTIEKDQRFQVSKELLPSSNGCLFKVSVIKCNSLIEKMRLIPLTGKDYALIEQYSDYFEENLLNQIQVVNNNQVIPFYLNNIGQENSYIMLKVQIDIEYGFISSDCEIIIDHITDNVNEEMSKEIIKKTVKVKFNKKKCLLRIPQIIDLNKPIYSYICFVSLENTQRNMLSRLCDFSLIKSFYEKGKPIDNQFPYMKTLWLSMSVHENELINQIILPSYTTINTCLFQNDYVDLYLYNYTDVIINKDNYLTKLSINLIIDYCQCDDNLVVSAEIVYFYLKDEINKSNLLVFTCDFIYLLLISNRKIAIRISLLNKGEVKALLKINKEPLPIILFKELFQSALSIKIHYSHDLNILYSYTLLSKSNRHLNLSSQLVIPKKFKLFNKQILLENTSFIIKQIENYYYGKDYRNSGILLLPKIYNFYSLCKVIINKISYLDLYNSYLDLNIINFKDSSKEIKEYLKQMTENVLSIDESKRNIVIIKGIERLIYTSGQQCDDNSEYSHNNIKFIGYYLSKYLSKIRKRNNNYLLLVSLGNDCIANCQNMQLQFLINNADIHRFNLGFITLKQLNKLGYQFNEKYRSNLIIEDIIAMDKMKNDISDYTPLNSQQHNSKQNAIDFSSICNMEKVKNELIDTISLSIKAKELFFKEKLPIQFNSGVLLIGPSGCGKSFIASSIEKQFNINFYSIKCTDVLSKYIGESEYIIRQYFSKAKENSPCVLFFDELEALTPIRGSGSSGVTDRIVNQILTYLDGIDAKEDVFVIGASSHPNMIDSAMLRPGRLDKTILCDYPTKEERINLIKYFIKQSKCICDISPLLIETISNNSTNYTPADLNDIVYNAYLQSVKSIISTNKQVVVTDTELKSAFKAFKKIINEDEVVFYNQYRLKNSIPDSFGLNNSIVSKIGTKSTLI